MLASIGRGYSTFQLVVTIIFSVGMIAAGLYILTKQPPEQPSQPGKPVIPDSILGTIAIFIGILAPIAAWVRRKLIRSNPVIAEIAGAVDIARFLDFKA